MTLDFFIHLFVATAFAMAPHQQGDILMSSAPAIMVKIAQCESRAQQFTSEGKVVYNPKSGDFGVFQINKMHLKTAQNMGLDVMTLEGNIRYALHLYSKNGTRDWNSSKACWAPEGT